MYRLRRECRRAHRDILGSAGLRAAVPDPFTRMGDDSLAGANIDGAALVLDAKQSAQHERDLLELRALSGLDPSFGRHHARHTHARVPRIHSARELFDLLWLVARGVDDGRALDQSW